jgi:hypothetical protein
MPAYVMITHLPKDTAPQTLLAGERRAVHRIERECPDVDWVATYEIEGSGDYLDIFRAPDLDTAERVSALATAPVHATADLWPAADWPDFRELVHSIQQAH